jgi:hypothetical protein
MHWCGTVKTARYTNQLKSCNSQYVKIQIFSVALKFILKLWKPFYFNYSISVFIWFLCEAWDQIRYESAFHVTYNLRVLKSLARVWLFIFQNLQRWLMAINIITASTELFVLFVYLHWRYLWLSSVPPGKCRDRNLNPVTHASFYILFNSIFTVIHFFALSFTDSYKITNK